MQSLSRNVALRADVYGCKEYIIVNNDSVPRDSAAHITFINFGCLIKPRKIKCITNG